MTWHLVIGTTPDHRWELQDGTDADDVASDLTGAKQAMSMGGDRSDWARVPVVVGGADSLLYVNRANLVAFALTEVNRRGGSGAAALHGATIG